MTGQRGGPIELIVLDVGGTLGESTAPTVSSRLIDLSPLPSAQVEETIQHVLLVTPFGDMPSAEDLCHRLQIDPAEWPQECVTAPFRMYPGAAEAVVRLARTAPVVTLSNSPAWHAHHHATVAAACAPHLSAVYTSYGLRVPAKPHPDAFIEISRRHKVEAHNIATIGDRWHVDVDAALAAGVGTIVWLTESPGSAPDSNLLESGRVRTAGDITDAVQVINDVFAVVAS